MKVDRDMGSLESFYGNIGIIFRFFLGECNSQHSPWNRFKLAPKKLEIFSKPSPKKEANIASNFPPVSFEEVIKSAGPGFLEAMQLENALNTFYDFTSRHVTTAAPGSSALIFVHARVPSILGVAFQETFLEGLVPLVGLAKGPRPGDGLPALRLPPDRVAARVIATHPVGLTTSYQLPDRVQVASTRSFLSLLRPVPHEALEAPQQRILRLLKDSWPNARSGWQAVHTDGQLSEP